MPTERTPQGEGARPGRDAKRLGRPHTAPDAAKPADGQAPVQAATDSKSGVRQKQGRRGKPAAEEPPKTEQAAPGDAAKEDASRDAAKAETAATDPAKTDAIKTDAIKGEVDKPASEAAKSAGEVGQTPRPPRSMLPRRTPAASRRRSGQIRCRRSRRRRQLPQRPRLSRPQALLQRRLHR